MAITERSDEPTIISVSLGEMKVSRDSDVVLACYGLGSCIGVSAHDTVARVGGMIHVVLPTSDNGTDERSPAKYANTGFPALIQEMEKHGAKRFRIIIKVAGGASMLNNPNLDKVFDMGGKNIVAIKEAMRCESIVLRAADVGGTSGRTLYLSVQSGTVKVRKAGSGTIEL